MKRYVISLLVFLAGVCFTVLISVSIWSFIDIVSFISVGIFPFLFVSILFGFRNMASAFSSAVKKEAEKEKLLKAVEFFKFFGKITWIMAFISLFVGIVAMLINLDDKSSIGPNVALALISPLYGGLINAMVILPFTFLLKKQLADKG